MKEKKWFSKVPVIQQVLHSHFSPITENPTVHNPIPTFTNHILFTKPICSSLKLSESVPSPPPEMRYLGTHHVPTPKRRRLAPTIQSPSALAARGAVGKHHDAVVGLADLDVDVGLGMVVDDFLDFFGDYWAELVGGELGVVVGLVGL